MGQAKSRGSFQERCDAAIARQDAIRVQERLARQIRLDSQPARTAASPKPTPPMKYPLAMALIMANSFMFQRRF